MDHAIESLREHIRANAEVLKAFPNDDQLKADIMAMIRGVQIMEIHAYGRAITKYKNIIK